MWTIKRIDEADFGCEERLPGELLMVLVSLECDDGRMLQLEVADNCRGLTRAMGGRMIRTNRMKKMRKAQSRCSGWRVIWMLWRSWNKSENNKNIDKTAIS